MAKLKSIWVSGISYFLNKIKGTDMEMTGNIKSSSIELTSNDASKTIICDGNNIKKDNATIIDSENYKDIIAPEDIGASSDSHTHNYAGSDISGGAATSANKINTNAGTATAPVYFADGIPKKCTYTLSKSVPSSAKFTDTTYSNFVKSGSGAKSGLVPAPPTTAGSTKYLREDGTWTDPPTNTGPKGDTGSPGTDAGFGTPTATVDSNTGTPSVTVTASGPDTAKVFDFEFKNLKGATGAKGATGTRGSTWTTGTAITGTSTTATIFSSSGITNALVNDMYLNTSTGYVYRCSVAGAASAAKWVYVGSIKGATGAKGATGTRGSTWTTGTAITGTSTTATIFSSSGITNALVNDMYLNTSTGYVYRCSVAGAASAAKWVYVGSIKGATGAKGATGPKGDPVSFYGTCSTAAATAAKVVACTGFALTTGSRITVVFDNVNSADSITLNVNNTGAKAVYCYGGAMTYNLFKIPRKTGVDFVYDGTNWVYCGQESYVSQTNTTEDSDRRILLSNSDDDEQHRNVTNKSNKFTANPSTGVLSAPTFNGALTGNATSATKLDTARTINGISFNGTSNIFLPSGRTWNCGAESSGSRGWFHFLTKSMSINEDFNLTLSIQDTFSTRYGIFHIHIRRNTQTTCPVPNMFGWIVRHGWDPTHIIGVVDGLQIKFYIYSDINKYNHISFAVIHRGHRTGFSTSYTAVTSTSPTDNLTAGITSKDLTSVSGSSIENLGKVILDTTVSGETSLINKTGLFTDNKLIWAMITSNKYGTNCYLIPMQYLKSQKALALASVGSNNNSCSDAITFKYDNDDTMVWFEYQASGAATYTRSRLIKIL